MKLHKGKDTYTLPPYSEIISVVLDERERDPGGPSFMLYSVPALAIEKCKPETPKRYAVSGDKIIFSPPPDRAYEVKVRYHPPMMEC